MGWSGCRRAVTCVVVVAVGFGVVGVPIAGADPLPGGAGPSGTNFVAHELASQAREATGAARRGDGTFHDAGQAPGPQSRGWNIDTTYETFMGDGLLTTSVEVNQVARLPGTAGSGSRRASFSVDTCPDAEGNVDGSGTIVLAETRASGTSGSTVINISSFGTVGDNGALREYRFLVEGQIDADRATSGDETSWTQAGGNDSSGAFRDAPTVRDGQPGGPQSTENVTSEAQTHGRGILAMVDAIYRAAEKFWQNNGCVKVEVKPPSKLVKPKEKFKVTGKGVSKIDGGDIRRALTGTLQSGTTSLDGGDGRAPTTTFKFVGPKDKDKAVVRIKSTSKRGIGWTDVTYTTKALDYKVNDDVIGIHWSAIKCGGVAGEWVVDLTNPIRFTKEPARFTFPSEPEEHGSVDSGYTEELIWFDENDGAPQYADRFFFTFYADGADSPFGAPVGAPLLLVKDPIYTGEPLQVQAGDFCKDAN